VAAVNEDGQKIGHTYSHPDLLLAATALQHGLTVVNASYRTEDHPQGDPLHHSAPPLL